MAEKKDNTKDNLAIYEKAREVPPTALKEIKGGRLKGMSDINPMYRIKRMTEIFGVCGFGWKYEIVKQWFEPQGQEVKAFCQINLYIKLNDEWSEPIPGVGGAGFVEREKNGLFVNDEGPKMALTDALSVSMKALGIAADVYWGKDGNPLNPGDSKYAYDTQVQPAANPAEQVGQAYPSIDFETEMKAEQEAYKCETTVELTAIWNKYTQKSSPFYNPAYANQNGVFFKAVKQRGTALKNEGK